MGFCGCNRLGFCGATGYSKQRFVDIRFRFRGSVVIEKENKATQELAEKAALSGEFPEFSLEQLFRTLDIAKKSGVAKFLNQETAGSVEFKEGRVFNAQVEGREGEEALWALFRWDTGKFDVFFGDVSGEVKIDLDLDPLFEKCAAKNKAFTICTNELPPFRTVLTLDQQELLNHIGKMSDTTGTILKLFDGQKTIDDVILVSEFSEVETLEKIVELFDLKILVEGAASIAPPVSTAPAQPQQSQALSVQPDIRAKEYQESETLKPLTLVQQKPVVQDEEETKTFFEQEQVRQEPTGSDQVPVAETTAANTNDVGASSAAPAPLPVEQTPSAGALVDPANSANFDASKAEVVSVQEWKTTPLAESGISKMAPAFNDAPPQSQTPAPVHSSAPPPVSVHSQSAVVPGAPVGEGKLQRSQNDLQSSSEHIFQQGQESQANWQPLQKSGSETVNEFEDLDDSLDQLPRSKMPLYAGIGAGVLVLVGIIAMLSGGDESSEVTEAAEVIAPAPKAEKATPKKKEASAATEAKGGFEVPATKSETVKEKAPVKATKKSEKPALSKEAQEKKAQAALKKSIKSHLRKGMSYYKSGKTEKAISEFKEVVALDANHDAAHAQLGAAYFDLDQNALALKHLEKAVSVNSRNAQAVLLLGNVYQSTNRSADAKKSYERYLEIAPDGNWAEDVKLILKTLR